MTITEPFSAAPNTHFYYTVQGPNGQSGLPYTVTIIPSTGSNVYQSGTNTQLTGVQYSFRMQTDYQYVEIFANLESDFSIAISVTVRTGTGSGATNASVIKHSQRHIDPETADQLQNTFRIFASASDQFKKSLNPKIHMRK